MWTVEANGSPPQYLLKYNGESLFGTSMSRWPPNATVTGQLRETLMKTVDIEYDRREAMMQLLDNFDQYGIEWRTLCERICEVLNAAAVKP